LNTFLDWDSREWESPVKGVQQKSIYQGDSAIHLIRLHPELEAQEWHIKGQAGMVLEGELVLEFESGIRHYPKGTGIWIGVGEASQHKASVSGGQMVELLLFENIG